MKKYKKKIDQKYKKVFVILSFFVLIIIFSLYLIYFFIYRYNNQKNGIIIRNPPRYAILKNSPQQDNNVVLDYPIQSSGCGTDLSVLPGATSNLEIQNENKKRTYLLYLPSSYRNTKQYALILSFHGYASNDLAQERISQFNLIAEKNDVIVVYPQGTTGKSPARGWNTGHHPYITANDILFVSNILNTLQSNLCINPNQIYATGFSNGGGFVAELACKMSNRIAAFAPISGSYVTSFSSCTTKRPISIIEFHGTADTVNPYGGITAINEFSIQFWLGVWAKKDGCAAKPTITQESSNIIKYIWSSCNDDAKIAHYKIVGEGHMIPNMKFKLKKNGKNYLSNISNVIWDFFQQHPLK